MRQPIVSIQLRSLDDRVEIASGVLMPRLGLGTFRVHDGSEVEAQVGYGLGIGYRGIDTAALYRNEEGVGRALRASGLPRDQVFVASKVWNSDQGYESTLGACDRSLERLGLDYLDLYLVHWPDPKRARDTWRAMEEIKVRGKARAIGVCNHMIVHLLELLGFATVPPAVNQIEHHPLLQRPELRRFCQKRGITVQAWAPLMQGRVDSIPELGEIARRNGKSPAQVSIRWILQRGVTAIPKSVHPERLAENANVFDFALNDEDMAAIDALDKGTI